MSAKRATGDAGAESVDPSTDPTERNTADAFDHEAEARGDHTYESSSTSGVYAPNGKPLDLPTVED